MAWTVAVVGEGGRLLRNYDVVLPLGEAMHSVLDDVLQSARDAGADINATVERELNANEDRIATLLRDIRDSRSKDEIDSLSKALTTLVDYGRYLKTFAMPTRIEQVYSRVASKENLRMWGKLYLPKGELTGGGWLIDSWAEGGAPYWRPKMSWLDRKENKLQRAYLNFETGAIQYGQDKEIEPERAKFIRETIEQWEKDWLQAQGEESKRT